MLCSGGFGNMLVQMCEEVKGNSFKCPTLGFRMRTLLSIQLVCEADVLAFGAEAQTTSLAPQRNNILMDLVVVTRIIWMSFNHYEVILYKYSRRACMHVYSSSRTWCVEGAKR